MRTERMEADALLRIEELRVSYPGPPVVQAVQDVSLSVGRGECLGIVGESGAGKSQLFLAALGLLSATARIEGRAWFDSQPLLERRAAELDRLRGARIGLVFQDPMSSLTPHLQVGDQIAEPMVRHMGISWREGRRAALELLHRVHLSDPAQRMGQYPHELSGGMRQRVMLAIALSCQPALLIADEPTTALDVTTQAQILALLLELKQQRRMSLVLITHDLGVLAGIADRVAVMKEGRLVECGDVRRILREPRQPYTRALLDAVPKIEPMTAPESALESGPPAAARQPTASQSPRAASLELEGVSVRFRVKSGPWARRRNLCALDEVGLALAAGEALGVVGESGSGKSTLARAALQLLPVHAGRIVWLGRCMTGLRVAVRRTLRAGVQMVFQDPLASLDPRLTVQEIVAEPLRVHRPELSRDARRALVYSMLQQVGLDESLGMRFPHQLSGGQCQRVGIARAMVLQPQVLVCDEPLSALDVTVQRQISALLRELTQRAGLALLFISHDLAAVRQLCDRILVLYLGRMMELGTSSALLGAPRHPYTRELLLSAPVADPDLQPERLRRVVAGEAPSPLDPPSGCVYRTRCPHATALCSAERPAWDADPLVQHHVACHHWRKLASQFGGGGEAG